MPNVMLKNATIYSEDEIFERGVVQIYNGKIAAVGKMAEMVSRGEDDEVVSLDPNHIVIPGFIDVHIHGAAGADTMDGTPEALETIAGTLPAEGTTSFLATTMTQSAVQIEKALSNVGDYLNARQTAGAAEVLGVHLEGPFVSPKQAGAQPVEYMIHPEIEQFKRWQKAAQGRIKLVTLAPEREGGLDFIRYLTENGVVASVGHSNATYDQVVDAISAGATHVTHLYNGMSSLHHREPGVTGAALLLSELLAEMIVDGIHIRPEMVKLAYRQKGAAGLILITDAIRAKCLKNGVYDLGGQNVTVKDGEAHLSNGSLAGSTLKMKDAIRNVMDFSGCSLTDVIQMGAANPAKELNVYDHKGSLSPGKDADLVVLDRDLNVVMTLCRGEVAYRQE